MYYITAYKRTTPPQGHTDPMAVLDALNEHQSHKITFEVASPNMLTFEPSHLFPTIGHMTSYYRCTDYMFQLPHELSHAAKANLYRTFRIPKRSGGMREIKAPNDALKKTQKSIYKYFSEELHILEHECAYGFVKGRNCKASLLVHKARNSRWFLKLDFHNFFPSFDIDLLTRQLMCNAGVAKFHAHDLQDYLFLCTDETGKLVQGSPCSPYLANIAMIPFDNAFFKWCNTRHLTYTRYADDMLISGTNKFDWHEVVEVVLALLNTLGYSNLSLSADKTRFGSFNGANWNLGLMYNNEFNVTVGHRNKRLFKVIAHKWNTLTPEEQSHWRGVFNYYRYIEPEYFSQERFNIC